MIIITNNAPRTGNAHPVFPAIVFFVSCLVNGLLVGLEVLPFTEAFPDALFGADFPDARIDEEDEPDFLAIFPPDHS